MASNNRFGIPFQSSAEIRRSFIDFFVGKDHVFVPSAPVAVYDDPTLLFTNSGMNQFKQIFLGDNPKGLRRAVNSQKCLRVSGKHNDLDEVGADGTHHTFFEMLGNWSFGDYFKKEAITMAWELLTVRWQMPKDRLFVTVHKDDDEAAALWLECTDIAQERILRFERENFWEMGEVGPCGPSTEIFFDHGPDTDRMRRYNDPLHGVNGSSPEAMRFVEIWNLVFMQFERKPDGSLEKLAQTHVDTGSGLERVTSFIQGVDSNYETDLFMPIIREIERISGHPYERDGRGMPHRVIADHIRTLVFAVADGVTPANEGRGYVIRRILRRACRYGRKIDLKEPFLYGLADQVAAIMGDAHPESRARLDFVKEVVLSEEKRFMRTLGDGLVRFEKIASQSGSGKAISGKDAFTLFDTFGFPLDLTQLLAKERGMAVDLAEYQACMEEQRQRAKAAHNFEDDFASDEGWVILDPSKATDFTGYGALDGEVSTRRYLEKTDETLVVLDRSPFYAESGGQVGDTGTLKGEGVTLQVVDTFRIHNIHVHRCELVEGVVTATTMRRLHAVVDGAARSRTLRNHSATHLLHKALKEVLGEHVTQQGSRVGPDALRFDFTHSSAVKRDELDAIETLVNDRILANLPISMREENLDSAKKGGAIAMFGEKYGDTVRVISMGAFSKELCGGIHANATGDIGSFRIIAETSISTGIRRIEAVTGMGALELARSERQILSELAQGLKVRSPDLPARVGELNQQLKDQEKVIQGLKEKQAVEAAKQFLAAARAQNVKDVVVLQGELDPWAGDKNEAALLFEQSSRQLGDRIGVFVYSDSDNHYLYVAVSDGARGLFKAGDVLKNVAQKLGGKGGGRPDRAQGVLPRDVSKQAIWSAVNHVLGA